MFPYCDVSAPPEFSGTHSFTLSSPLLSLMTQDMIPVMETQAIGNKTATPLRDFHFRHSATFPALWKSSPGFSQQLERLLLFRGSPISQLQPTALYSEILHTKTTSSDSSSPFH